MKNNVISNRISQNQYQHEIFLYFNQSGQLLLLFMMTWIFEKSRSIVFLIIVLVSLYIYSNRLFLFERLKNKKRIFWYAVNTRKVCSGKFNVLQDKIHSRYSSIVSTPYWNPFYTQSKKIIAFQWQIFYANCAVNHLKSIT